MKTTRIKIKNLFGISETELDGRSIEVTGTNEVGKTSIIDAVKYALTNSSNKDYILKNGENEGEIIVETDTGLYINRKKRSGQADYKSVKDGGHEVPSPENFLSQLFTPLQIDPVAFTQMKKQDQNRMILDLIEFDWDLNWIKEKFGELPSGINYQQNILQVLNDIQAENGDYFRARQDINRDIRNKQAFIFDISKDIPSNYQAEVWESYDLGTNYKQLEKIKNENGVIQRAKVFKENYNNQLRGLEAEKEISISALERTINNTKTELLSTIERLKAEIIAAEEKLTGLETTKQDKIAVINANYETSLAKLDKDIQTADEYAGREVKDTTELDAELVNAEQMKKHLNEYNRMKTMQTDLDDLTAQSEALTQKIELARSLPGEILETATIPVEGMTVENGVPLIKDLPISNLSEGRQLELCVDIAISKPNALQIILLDGIEKIEHRKPRKTL